MAQSVQDGGQWPLSPPVKEYPLHWLTGQFHDPGKEAMYRRDSEPRIRAESCLTLSVAALIFGMFAISDYYYIGLSTELYLLLGMRALVVIACLALAFVIGQRGGYSRQTWLHALPLWILATGIILIIPLRPDSLSTQVTSLVVAIMAFYLLIPNLLPVVAIASLYLSVGFLVAAVMAADISAVVALRLLLLLVMANAVGFFALLRLEKLQRKQFALLQEERIQNHQLSEEIAHRKSLEKQLRMVAERDALTGLASRIHFMQRAQELLLQAQHDNTPFSLFMIDVDHFKAINDTWGHSQGDRVLTAIAKTCMQSLRAGDVIGRFGGEEFIVALPNTPLEEARRVAERLKKAVAELPVTEAMTEHRLTVTIGIAGELDAASDLPALIRQADQALYAGKHGGRNRVETSPAESRLP
ncbi:MULTISPECIES: GGDEF domain-containing protein [Modicisalibacter]|uniref:diguanylate cyclase n=1 Tax=Modicisalibacter tunisiensis TaxID=390637 RepID=A0ABS7WYN0_9GAMM|nr:MULTISPECIES: GGDEF domain-containing protein [Modicisalibacter]MBZ9567739.1 GGDEF domain-containing protein [Modicisalibacter tunisiensis]